ncbi:Pancreatic secretory granule membrane major glycoprotein GP2 [Exaiptasia diaphana]|nr:Pancreatic secretory granule membrane major glycoprotein GP2 [Exaiptasia diaphana]
MVDVMNTTLMNKTSVFHRDLKDLACEGYTNISDPTRNVNHVSSGTRKCDSDINEILWHRFVSPAGDRLPTTCPPHSRCQTDATGWLAEAPPTVAQGPITRKACFNWSRGGCCSAHQIIMVRNCGSFYTYKFTNPGSCYRYCATN